MASLWIETDLASLQDIAFKFDHVSLQSWSLSSRTLNALLRHNFKMTVGDVLRADESFATIRGLGTAGITELQAKVTQLVAEAHRNKKSPPSTAPLSSNISIKSLSELLYETAQKLPLDQLHLDTTTHKILVKAGITTIGELCNASNSRLRDIEGCTGLSPDSLGRVNGSIITLLNSLNQEGEINWFQYWSAQEIEILPSGYTSNVSFEQIIRGLPKIIEEVLHRELDERAWIIIQRRFGLRNTEKLTLEEIGDAFGITRERIRQLEEKALKILQNVLIEQFYAGKKYHVHPQAHLIVQTIRNILAAEPSTLILETNLLELVARSFNVDPKKVKSSLFLLLTLLGIERIEFDYPHSVPVWGYIEPVQHRILEGAIKRLDDFLTRETSFPYSEFDVLVHINKGMKKSEKLTLTQLPWLIDLCNSVERREDGSIWGKFECLKGRANQVERILLESGSPMDIAEIAREINHRLVPFGHRQLVETNLSNQLAGNDRFAPIGRSGKWGLKSWQHVDTKSILALMEQYLITRNKPATVDEVYTYVSERRPVSKKSIITYLTMEKEAFARIGRNTWGLAKWSDVNDAQTWNMEQVADFIANIFKKYKVKELDYKIIKEALMQEAGVSAKQAQGLLNYNPVIKTRRGTKWGERIAVFQVDYKDMLVQAKTSFSQRSVSLRQQIEQSVYNILEVLPDKQMPMAELIQSLQKRFDCSEVTLYQYVRKMNSIDRIDAPTSHTKICRMKNIKDTASGGTLRHRISESVRGILESTPDKQISLAELIKRLRKEYNCPKASLYHYISDLDFIERIHIPHLPNKMCRLKGAEGTQAFPQVYHIVNTTLKEKIVRALPFLNEENVDIGLFLLSKEFEATLKAYLINANMKGKLSVLPQGKTPDKWNLNGMVECAKDNGIITDYAVFHYLRQARNDRAHGTMPSLAERQLLMKSIQYIAGLYIDYIKLLDDLTQNL